MKKIKGKNLESYFSESDDELSLIRHKWFIKFLKNNLQKYNFKNANVLDVGCGNGNLLYEFKELGTTELHGIDYSDYSQKQLRTTISFKKADLNIQTLKQIYGSKKFDITSCTETLEHLFNPELVFKNIVEQTGDGGYILITIPLDTNISRRIRILLGENIHNPFTVGSHIKFFKPNDFFDMIQNKKNIKIINSDFIGLGYGIYDSKMPLLKFLAKHWPSLFASGMMILLQKKR